MFYLHGPDRSAADLQPCRVPGQLKAILLVPIVRDTIYFVSTQLFVRLKRLATMVTLKRTRRLISPDVSPDFRVDDPF
jgi:hypothetical protein